MPRIRKKTSNRTKLHDRAKIKKKVRESRKKKAKAARKNPHPQWKSKTPKDPGIPNDFPYKDQILAEVMEQRRIADAEKQRKKEEKAKARAIARGELLPDEEEAKAGSGDEGEDASIDGLEGEKDGSDSDVDMVDEAAESSLKKGKRDLNVGAESIASLSAKTLDTKLKPRPKAMATVQPDEEDDEDEEVPLLVNHDLPNLKAVLEKADVVLHVLDSRDPLSFRIKQVEELAKELGKKVVFVLNKIDCCPRDALAAWVENFRSQNPSFVFRSATSFLPEFALPQNDATLQTKKGKGKAPVTDSVGAQSILSYLSSLAKEKTGEESFSVAVVGLTNVGKSSLVNSLIQKSALPIYELASSVQGPSTTEFPQEVSLTLDEKTLTFIDTPGLSFWPQDEADEATVDQYRMQDILLRNRGRIDKLKDPGFPISYITARGNTEDLMLLYNLPAFVKGDHAGFLAAVARSNQLVKRKGELDIAGAARIVLKDWNVGRLARYSVPPKTAAATTSTSTLIASDERLTELYTQNDAIIEALPTRKDLRTHLGTRSGLVRFVPGKIEERKVVEIEESWVGSLNEDDDDEEEEGDGSLEVGDDGDEDEEAWEDDDEEEEDEEPAPPPPPVSKKNKRKRGADAEPEPVVAERPAKKVSFVSTQLASANGKMKKPKGNATTLPVTEAVAQPSKVKAKEGKEMKPSPPVQLKGVLKASTSTSAAEKGKKGKAVVESKVVEDDEVKPVGKEKKAKKAKKGQAVEAETVDDTEAAAPPVKKAKVAKPVKPKTNPAASSTKSKTKNKEKNNSEPEAYDFGKFF